MATSYICKTVCNVSDKRGNVTVYKPGQATTKIKYNKMNPIQRDKFEVIVTNSNGSRNPYTRDEITEIVSLYLINDNVRVVRDTFMDLNPNTLHSRDSVNALIGQLRAMDNRYPSDTEWDVKSLVAEVAHEMASERFA